MHKILLTSLVMAAFAASPAAAQTTGGLVTPFVGVATGTPIDENRTVYGGSIGATGSVIGFEFDFGYSPNFYEIEDDFGELGSSGSVSTLMGNLLIGLPLGRVRPYATFGAGLMRSNLDVFDVFDDLDRSDFGVNYGGGVMAFLTDHVGIRISGISVACRMTTWTTASRIRATSTWATSRSGARLRASSSSSERGPS